MQRVGGAARVGCRVVLVDDARGGADGGCGRVRAGRGGGRRRAPPPLRRASQNLVAGAGSAVSPGANAVQESVGHLAPSLQLAASAYRLDEDAEGQTSA